MPRERLSTRDARKKELLAAMRRRNNKEHGRHRLTGKELIAVSEALAEIERQEQAERAAELLQTRAKNDAGAANDITPNALQGFIMPAKQQIEHDRTQEENTEEQS